MKNQVVRLVVLEQKTSRGLLLYLVVGNMKSPKKCRESPVSEAVLWYGICVSFIALVMNSQDLNAHCTLKFLDGTGYVL